MSDLPEDMQPGINHQSESGSQSWSQGLLLSIEQQIAAGHTGIADEVIPEVEKILITAALNKTTGRRNDAAKLLGWGRNTLTRKIKDYDMNA
jgi:two-component system nitrogen regulation response regulator GlnG